MKPGRKSTRQMGFEFSGWCTIISFTNFTNLSNALPREEALTILKKQ